MKKFIERSVMSLVASSAIGCSVAKSPVTPITFAQEQISKDISNVISDPRNMVDPETLRQPYSEPSVINLDQVPSATEVSKPSNTWFDDTSPIGTSNTSQVPQVSMSPKPSASPTTVNWTEMATDSGTLSKEQSYPTPMVTPSQTNWSSIAPVVTAQSTPWDTSLSSPTPKPNVSASPDAIVDVTLVFPPNWKPTSTPMPTPSQSPIMKTDPITWASVAPVVTPTSTPMLPVSPILTTTPEPKKTITSRKVEHVEHREDHNNKNENHKTKHKD